MGGRAAYDTLEGNFMSISYFFNSFARGNIGNIRRIPILTTLLIVYLFLNFENLGEAGELKGLVVYFPFEEGKGKEVKDLSENGNNGTLEGDTEWTKGRFGGGMKFGGKNGIVRADHSKSMEFADGLTAVAWIRPTLKRGAGEWQLIAAKGLDAKEFFEILLHPDGFIWMGWLLEGGRIVPAQSPRKVKADLWQHVAVSFQSGKWWTVYLDGEVLIDYPKQGAKLFPNNSPLFLGVEEPFGLNRYYNGDIDEFALFNRGLSQEEIKKIQEGIQTILSVSRPEANLLAVWGDLKRKYN